MKFIIREFEIIHQQGCYFVSQPLFAVKLSNACLFPLLKEIKQSPHAEITQEEFRCLIKKHKLTFEHAVDLLSNQLKILKPLLRRKLEKIYINCDSEILSELLTESITEYDVVCQQDCVFDETESALVLFFRNNYSSDDYKKLYQSLHKNLYLITAGIAHHVLIIDNLYYQHSGLPSHFSHFNELLANIKGDMPLSKNNWVVLYRQLMKQGYEHFPDSYVNPCQQGYIAYCLLNFTKQFIGLWDNLATLDQLNWYWHVDLNNFSIHKDVAIHSPFSEYDMGLNLSKLQVETK